MDNTRYIHPPDFYKGLDLFNREFYYECHDVWEEIWGDAKGMNRVYYQALIMSAVSLYHFGNENLEGALSCFQKALKQFGQLPEIFLALNITEFAGQMKEFYEGVSVAETQITKTLMQRRRPKLNIAEDGNNES